MLCYITCVMLSRITYVMFCYDIGTEQNMLNMLYNMFHVRLYNTCHIMLYNMCLVISYNTCDVKSYNISCYVI